MKFILVSKVMGISVKPAKLRTVLFNWSRFDSVTLLCFTIGKKPHMTLTNLGLETVVSVLFTNTRTRLPFNERDILNTARSGTECSIENFEFIVR